MWPPTLVQTLATNNIDNIENIDNIDDIEDIDIIDGCDNIDWGLLLPQAQNYDQLNETDSQE